MRFNFWRASFTLITCAMLTVVPTPSLAATLPVMDGLLARFESDAGLQLNGSQVIAWEDQATGLGGANNATNTGGNGTGPTLTANGINGFPTLNFNGSTQYLQIGGNAAFDTDTFTWIIVTQYTRNTASTQTLLNSAYSTGAGAASNELWGTETGKGDPLAYAHSASGSSNISAGFGSNNPMVLSGVWGSDDTLTQWINGRRSLTQTGADANPSGHLATQIGKPADISTSFFSGNISEILIYDRSLSGVERQQVESFLGDKYNVAIVPEPSAVALLALAGAALMSNRRRQQSKS